jgi:hypothetical protein
MRSGDRRKVKRTGAGLRAMLGEWLQDLGGPGDAEDLRPVGETNAMSPKGWPLEITPAPGPEEEQHQSPANE